MKLELKYLLGYLPYGLKFDGKRNGWLNFDGTVKTLCVIDLDGRWELIKPILRPLSDLTKEIQVNGKNFVPLYYNAFREDKDFIIEFQNGFLHHKAIKYGIINKLLEWHFDIYGLIDAGLATDINTLKK